MSNTTLCFAGDFVFNANERVQVAEPLKSILKKSDVFSINLEAPLKGTGVPMLKSGPSLTQKEEAVQILHELGANVINCANNHICDFGREALANTLNRFADCVVVGAGVSFDDAYQLKTQKINGITVGFLSFAEWAYGAICDEEDTWGYAWVNHERVNRLVQSSAEKCDVLIVQVHAGVEEMDIPLPEWRKRYKELIDIGASAIIANHPHVPQGWEFYKEAPIFYSLGNFWFDMESNHPLWNKSIVAKLTIDDTSHQIKAEALPVERKGNTVLLSTDEQFLQHLQQLNKNLEEPIYSDLLNKEMLALWEERYKRFYLNSLNGIDSFNIIRILKVVKRLFMRRTVKTVLLHHLLCVESHFWAVNRALNLIHRNLI